MQYVLAGLAVSLLAAVVIGLLRGSLSVRSCCAVVDRRKDARMRGAFAEDGAGPGRRVQDGYERDLSHD